MSFKLNSNTVSRRRYSGGIAFSSAGGSSIALPTVSGGILGSDETYFYRAFLSSDVLTVADGPLVTDVLVVGGGGSGGVSGYYRMQSYVSGGGGAGDLLLSEQVSLSPDAYIATVGGGASGVWAGDSSYSSGNSGSPSSLLNANTLAVVSNLTASGGGYGENAAPGKGGDSGTRVGGAGRFADWQPYPSGGGGAGAGQPGNPATPGYRAAGAGPGGDGTFAFASWLVPLGMGVDDGTGNIYFGGGGGGTQQFNWSAGPGTTYVSGGKGGGGLGFSKYGGGWPELNVVANTGSGSGGTANNYQSGNGGSGFIIFRYLKTAVAA